MYGVGSLQWLMDEHELCSTHDTLVKLMDELCRTSLPFSMCSANHLYDCLSDCLHTYSPTSLHGHLRTMYLTTDVPTHAAAFVATLVYP